MVGSINDVEEALSEAENEVQEFLNSIREIQWDNFDFMTDSINDTVDEMEFLVDLMSHKDLFSDKGIMTNEGMATLGQYATKYNLNMGLADKYREEIFKLNQALSTDPYNKDLLERRQELIKLQQESILNAEEEKEAMIDLIREGVEKQIEAMEELIDKKKEALVEEKALYDYQQTIAEKTQRVTDIEKQIEAVEGDDSEEGRKNIQDLKNQLEEAKADLEETEYDRWVSDQKDLLDQLLTNYTDTLNAQFDNVDLLISNLIDYVNANSGAIGDTIIANTDKVGYIITEGLNNIWNSNNGLTNVVSTYVSGFDSFASGVNNFIGNFWNGISSNMNTYTSTFTSHSTTIQNYLKSVITTMQQMQASAEAEAQAKIEAQRQQQQAVQNTKPQTPPPAPTPAPKPQNSGGGDGVPRIGDAVKFNSGMYYYSSDGLNPSGNQMLGQTVYITNINNASWAKKPYHVARDKAGTRPLGWLSLNQISGYKTGTRSVPRDDIYRINEEGEEIVFNPSDGSILTYLPRGNVVFNKEATDNMYAMANNPADFIGGYVNASNPHAIPVNKVSSTENTVNVEVNIDKVADYNDFLAQMQNDKKFERLVHAMTFDQMLGKGKMTKYNIRI